MVGGGDAKRAAWLAALREDLVEFKAAHIAETRGSRTKFVEARLIPLPGLVLTDLSRAGMIDWDGGTAFRPKR